MGDVEEKYRGELLVLSLKKEVVDEGRKGLLMREEEKRGATKAEADRAQVEVAMRGTEKSGAAMVAARFRVAARGCHAGGELLVG